MNTRPDHLELFRPGRRIHGNVVLNFVGSPKTEFGAFAGAFWRAGRSLAKSLATSHGYHDLDACPIVFLYRHALELYLKAIVLLGQDVVALAGKKLPLAPRALARHELTPLLEPTRYIFRHLDWKWKTDVDGVKTFRDFQALVRDIDRLDGGSFTFRYPIDTKGKSPVFHHFVFNVLEFAQEVEGAVGPLDGALTGLEELWDQQASDAYARQKAD